MTTPKQKLKQYSAENFPAVTDDWPYWWIEGDSYCLAIVDGSNLMAAVEIVEDNWERFDSIKVHKAKLVDSDIIRRDKNTVGISDQSTSRKYLEECQKADKIYDVQADSNDS